MGDEEFLFKIKTEIRSAADFTVIHNFEGEMSPTYSANCFHFNNDILAISSFRFIREEEGGQSKIESISFVILFSNLLQRLIDFVFDKGF